MNNENFSFLEDESPSTPELNFDLINNNEEPMIDWMSDMPTFQTNVPISPLCITHLGYSPEQQLYKLSTNQLVPQTFSPQYIYAVQQLSPHAPQLHVESPNADLETSLSADEQKYESVAPKTAMTKSSLMDLVEGFITPPSQKQYGGKDNREVLPIHIVRVHTSMILSLQALKLKIKVDLHGYKKMSKVKTHLAHVAELPLQVTGNDVDVTFDELVVRHSSHNCGQKLLLRFTLMDENNQSYDFVDTAEFETITKRGIEKQRQKQKASKKRDLKTYKFKSYEQPQVVKQQPTVYSVPQQPQQQLWFAAPRMPVFAMQQSQVLANPSILDILLDSQQFRSAVLQ